MVDTAFVSPRFASNASLRDVLNGRATLKRGSAGQAVIIVQSALIDLGESMSSGADGDFGTQTYNAVTNYQRTRGLTADGIIGRNTMSRLDADIVTFDSTDHTDPLNMMTVSILGSTWEELREVVLEEPLDFGCKPFIRSTLLGFALPALVTPTQYASLTARGRHIRLEREHIPPERRAAVTLGIGDRFRGGQIAPRGLGSQPGATINLGGIMSVDEVSSAIEGLSREYGIGVSALEPTVHGAQVFLCQAGNMRPEDCHVYFTAGVHARERGGPDNLIYFIADLLYAKKYRIGLTYGSQTYTYAQVMRVLSTGIVFIPLVNPEGVRWDHETDSLWRKNRNGAMATPNNDKTIGVDINRNFDFLFDFSRYFDSRAQDNAASTQPAEDTYHGPRAFSEAETRNVRQVFDDHENIRWYMDIHSAAGYVCYSWGNDNNQTTDPQQNFLNPTFDHKRGVLKSPRSAIDNTGYAEYIDQREERDVKYVAERVANAMVTAGNRPYEAKQSVAAAAASGASDDYAYSRNKLPRNPPLNKVYGFTMEFGYDQNFYPTLAEFQENVLDTGAGFMEFCLAAADVGLV